MPELTFAPLTPARWPDLERLFGPRGACAGCWCMWFRLPRSTFDARKGEGNRQAFREVVEAGPPPGILAFAGDEPIAWCAVAPRDRYPRLARSRILAQVDDAPVCAITCQFVAKSWRRRGVTVRLLEEAVRFARENGAGVVEGYPVDAADRRYGDAFVYHGVASAFRRAGFVEVLRRSPTRPIMRTAP